MFKADVIYIKTFLFNQWQQYKQKLSSLINQELDGPAVSALRRVIVEVKQHWSLIGWMAKNLLSRAPPCFGRHVKQPVVPAAFTVVSTHQPALSPRGAFGSFSW
jgi:hypothetical protein